ATDPHPSRPARPPRIKALLSADELCVAGFLRGMRGMDIAPPSTHGRETRYFAGGRLDIHHARLGTLIGNRFVLEEALDQVPFGSAYRALDTHRPEGAL